ncbi:Glycosyltransferase involved in cell wall bisynthesis [Filimonas lacunae]|uniref:Glycosyltransferase involved in cell wall bisynthesis n=1 Tax=Filimonas lacunae TaxID=477680 RepID=A0A173MFB8_9BACT|nr:glycosyltransferase [Filimonas lacunae]BAV06265.1 glycosyl transferase, group 1 [Filimonas lacunae]SIT25548.1 Glycosyltransferase involved in cell wall bisynthesis [Filimonas lacunae]
MQKAVIIGPAHPLRGGLASFNERLARQFMADGYDTTIYTFSLQYPEFMYPGTTQYSSEPAPTDVNIKVCINSVNPLNWLKVGRELRKLQPDIIVVRYWLPLMGPCLGTILRQVKKNKHTKVVCIADNIIPHEKRPGDTPFTRYFVKPIDAFVTMSEKVMKDLRQFSQKPAQQVVHPLYDNFGTALDKTAARKRLGLDTQMPLILFFGFIRRYKGLDLLLQAMAIIKDKYQPLTTKSGERFVPSEMKLMVAGEFFEDAAPYQQLIAEANLGAMLELRTDFIPDSEVKYYLSAADFVIQPYRNATQSGVTPLAYHFEKPMLVTNVGGLPELVPNGEVGLVAEPTPESIAEHIIQLYLIGEQHFLPYLREEKKKYSWKVLTDTIRNL